MMNSPKRRISKKKLDSIKSSPLMKWLTPTKKTIEEGETIESTNNLTLPLEIIKIPDTPKANTKIDERDPSNKTETNQNDIPKSYDNVNILNETNKLKVMDKPLDDKINATISKNEKLKVLEEIKKQNISEIDNDKQNISKPQSVENQIDILRNLTDEFEGTGKLASVNLNNCYIDKPVLEKVEFERQNSCSEIVDENKLLNRISVENEKGKKRRKEEIKVDQNNQIGKIMPESENVEFNNNNVLINKKVGRSDDTKKDPDRKVKHVDKEKRRKRRSKTSNVNNEKITSWLILSPKIASKENNNKPEEVLITEKKGFHVSEEENKTIKKPLKECKSENKQILEESGNVMLNQGDNNKRHKKDVFKNDVETEKENDLKRKMFEVFGGVIVLNKDKAKATEISSKSSEGRAPSKWIKDKTAIEQQNIPSEEKDILLKQNSFIDKPDKDISTDNPIGKKNTWRIPKKTELSENEKNKITKAENIPKRKRLYVKETCTGCDSHKMKRHSSDEKLHLKQDVCNKRKLKEKSDSKKDKIRERRNDENYDELKKRKDSSIIRKLKENKSSLEKKINKKEFNSSLQDENIRKKDLKKEKSKEKYNSLEAETSKVRYAGKKDSPTDTSQKRLILEHSTRRQGNIIEKKDTRRNADLKSEKIISFNKTSVESKKNAKKESVSSCKTQAIKKENIKSKTDISSNKTKIEKNYGNTKKEKLNSSKKTRGKNQNLKDDNKKLNTSRESHKNISLGKRKTSSNDEETRAKKSKNCKVKSQKGKKRMKQEPQTSIMDSFIKDGLKHKNDEKENKRYSYSKYGINLPSFSEIKKLKEQLVNYTDKVNKAVDFIENNNVAKEPKKLESEPEDKQALGCETLTSVEIEEYFNKFLVCLIAIIKGEKYNWRHEEFVKSLTSHKNNASLSYSPSMGVFTSSQKDLLAELCGNFFDSFPIKKKTKYYFEVLLPEVCLRIFMDVHSMYEEDAISYLAKRPMEDVA